MLRNSVSIIIPTFNQPDALYETLRSIVYATKSTYKIYVMDNSVEKYGARIASMVHPMIRVFDMGGNVGWIKAINVGVSVSDEPYVLMLNDDVKILDFDILWLQKMIATMTHIRNCGAVGPTSNNVMGSQNFMFQPRRLFNITSGLSGFCILTKREIFKSVGGLDESLSGGDDLDFSIRILNAGMCLVNRGDVFVYHFGSLTGKSLYGNYWDSSDYQEKHLMEIIKKHGFKGMTKLWDIRGLEKFSKEIIPDFERTFIQKFAVGEGVDVGCGAEKIIPSAIGVDITPKGEEGVGGSQLGVKSVADITSEDFRIPFENDKFDYLCASHVIEHIVDDVSALEEWARVLKNDGRMIIATPNEELVDGVLLDPTHKHAYTRDSLEKKLSLVCKYEVEDFMAVDISFVLVVRVKK